MATPFASRKSYPTSWTTLRSTRPNREPSQLHSQSEGEEAVVAVRDTGFGIPPGQAKRIFEPFAQLPDSRHASAGGVGLGLALVKRLTELHDGRVNVASEGPGQGSCFTIRLPLHHALSILET